MTDFDRNAFNAQIVEEFRANDGVVGGDFEGAPMVLVHHVGAKSGTERVSPLVYQQLDDGWAIFASAAGSPKSPDWFHNLVANPDTQVEIGTDVFDVTATVASSEQRDPIWERQKEWAPQFAEYEAATTRTIPVVLLHRR